MIQKKTFLKTSDKTNIKWMETIHLYKGFCRKKSSTNFFLKNTAKKVRPPKLEYKGFKRKFTKKGDLVRSLLIRTLYRYVFNYSSPNTLKTNSSIIIKKKFLPKSKYFFGLLSKNLLKKKIITLFNKKL